MEALAFVKERLAGGQGVLSYTAIKGVCFFEGREFCEKNDLLVMVMYRQLQGRDGGGI